MLAHELEPGRSYYIIVSGAHGLYRYDIGDVVRVDAQMGGWNQPGEWWRTSKTISGGIMYDWGVHLLEYALQLLGVSDVSVPRQPGDRYPTENPFGAA